MKFEKIITSLSCSFCMYFPYNKLNAFAGFNGSKHRYDPTAHFTGKLGRRRIRFFGCAISKYEPGC